MLPSVTTARKRRCVVKAEHTPGPWSEEHFQYAGEHQRDIYAEMEDGSRVQVAAIAEMLGVRPHWEPEANARLITAAPELLAACQRISDWLHKQSEKDQQSARDTRIHTMRWAYEADAKNYLKMASDLDAVCAKARGEALAK